MRFVGNKEELNLIFTSPDVRYLGMVVTWRGLDIHERKKVEKNKKVNSSAGRATKAKSNLRALTNTSKQV